MLNIAAYNQASFIYKHSL